MPEESRERIRTTFSFCIQRLKAQNCIILNNTCLYTFTCLNENSADDDLKIKSVVGNKDTKRMIIKLD